MVREKLRRATPEETAILRAIADYQFWEGAGHALIPDEPLLKVSRRTGRIREIIDPRNNRRIASLRAATHTFIPTLYGASLLKPTALYPRGRVVVVDEMVEDVLGKSSLFARHVLRIDYSLRAGDEVLVVDEDDSLLCVGRLVLSPEEVLQFIRGTAVRLRECVSDETGRGSDQE